LNQNEKSARCHQWLGWLYGTLAILLAASYFFFPGEQRSSDFPVVVFLACFAFLACFGILHGAIAWGAKRKARWAWLLSQIIAFGLFFALPIGTLIALYLVGNNEWNAPPQPDVDT